MAPPLLSSGSIPSISIEPPAVKLEDASRICSASMSMVSAAPSVTTVPLLVIRSSKLWVYYEGD